MSTNPPSHLGKNGPACPRACRLVRLLGLLSHLALTQTLRPRVRRQVFVACLLLWLRTLCLRPSAVPPCRTVSTANRSLFATPRLRRALVVFQAYTCRWVLTSSSRSHPRVSWFEQNRLVPPRSSTCPLRCGRLWNARPCCVSIPWWNVLFRRTSARCCRLWSTSLPCHLPAARLSPPCSFHRWKRWYPRHSPCRSTPCWRCVTLPRTRLGLLRELYRPWVPSCTLPSSNAWD